MITISVRVCGDAWSNPDQVQAELAQPDPTVPVALDFHAEGISMQAIGLVKLLDQHCAQTGRDPGTITVINNPNTVEKTAYLNRTPEPSHCFGIVKSYWRTAPVPKIEALPFAYFMGRRTVARSFILYDLWHSYRDKFVFSSMPNRAPVPWIHPPAGVNLEKVQDWMDPTEFNNFSQWFASCPVTSIDGHTVRDHYDPAQNIHKDLLEHYDQFVTELVAETYTIGNTFFPTEKTLRPIMAARPIVVYGPRHFLSRLRDLGFETYSTCWDESYDELEGPARWQAIKELIPLIEVTDVTWAIAHRNRQHLRKMIYDTTNF